MGVTRHTQQGAWPGESRGCFLGREDLILYGHGGQQASPGSWIAR